MSTDLITIGAGLLTILILSAPIWLAPLTERWTKDDGRTYTGTWDE